MCKADCNKKLKQFMQLCGILSFQFWESAPQLGLHVDTCTQHYVTTTLASIWSTIISAWHVPHKFVALAETLYMYSCIIMNVHTNN